MTYADKLRDPRWQRRRLEILQRDKFGCTLCSDKTTELHIHHKSYHNEPWDAPSDELVTLCKPCHLLAEEAKKSNFKILAVKKIILYRNLGAFFLTLYEDDIQFGRFISYSEYLNETNSFSKTVYFLNEDISNLEELIKISKEHGK